MSEITLSKAVRSNLLNLQSTASLLSKSQERLSSGLRVNSALDNPTNFFTAQGLNSRASDLSQLADAVSNAVQTVAAADKGITAITKLVESAQATARQALQTAASVSTSTVSAQATVTGSVAIANDVEASANGSVTIASDVDATTTGSVTIAADTTAVLTGAALTGGNQMDSVAAAGTSLTLTIGSTAVTFDFYDGTAGAYAGSNIGINVDSTGTPVTITAALANMQSELRTATGNATATVGITGGNFEVTLGTDTTSSIAVSGNTTTGLGITNGTTEGPNNATLGSLSGTLTVGSNTLTFGAGNIQTRAQLATALAGLTGGFTGSITGNQVQLSSSAGASMTVGGTGGVPAALGITAQTYEATNATIGALSGTMTVGSNTLTFGAGNITNRAQLTAALAGFTGGVTGAITGNQLSFTGSASASFSVSESAGAATALGVATGAHDATNATLGSLSGTLTVGSNTLTFGAGNIQTRAQLTTALAGLTGGITGSITGNNLSFTGSGGASFTVGGTLDGSAAFGIAEQAYDATMTPGTGVNPKRAELVSTYNDLLGQIDALAKDSGFNGVNLLNGDNLSVIFNEDGSSKIDIAGVNNTTGVSGLNLASLASTAFDTNTGVNGVLDDLKGVIDKLRGQSAKFGSNLSVVETRQDFTKQMINVLQTGAANLTLADTNEEAANVLALQTRQQLSSTALSLASQADQNVLRLF